MSEITQLAFRLLSQLNPGLLNLRACGISSSPCCHFTIVSSLCERTESIKKQVNMALAEKTTIRENLDLICFKKKKNKVTLSKIKRMTEGEKKNKTQV